MSTLKPITFNKLPDDLLYHITRFTGNTSIIRGINTNTRNVIPKRMKSPLNEPVEALFSNGLTYFVVDDIQVERVAGTTGRSGYTGYIIDFVKNAPNMSETSIKIRVDFVATKKDLSPEHLLKAKSMRIDIVTRNLVGDGDEVCVTVMNILKSEKPTVFNYIIAYLHLLAEIRIRKKIRIDLKLAFNRDRVITNTMYYKANTVYKDKIEKIVFDVFTKDETLIPTTLNSLR